MIGSEDWETPFSQIMRIKKEKAMDHDALSKQVRLMASEMERMSARQQAQGEIIKDIARKHNSIAGVVETMAAMNAELLEKLHDKMEGLDKSS